MTHGVQTFKLVSGFPRSWDKRPTAADLEKQIAIAVLADCEVVGATLGFYGPPTRVRKVVICKAAHDQINTMWHGHRTADAESPPPIPLTYFVCAFGQNPPDSWVDVEVLPGLDRWDLPVM